MTKDFGYAEYVIEKIEIYLGRDFFRREKVRTSRNHSNSFYRRSERLANFIANYHACASVKKFASRDNIRKWKTISRVHV